MSADWQDISTAPIGRVVETIILDGSGQRNERRLIQTVREPGCRPLWWFEDRSMYVYYTPTHWRPVQQKAPSHD